MAERDDEITNGGVGSASAPLSASEEIAAALNDPNFQDTLAVASERGNNLATEGLGKDLLEASYGELVLKYGPEVAANRHKIQDGIARVDRTRQAERTTGEALGDTILGAGAGFVGLSGNTVGLAAGYGLGELFLDDGRLGAVATAQLTGDVTKDIKSYQSEELQARQRLQGIEGELDKADSKEQFRREIGEGDDPFGAALRAVGRDALNTGERILSDGAVAADIIAESVGSLGPSSRLAAVGGKLAAGSVSKITSNQVAQNIARTSGIAAGIGASEAGGAYAEAVDQVLNLSQSALENSPVYQALVAEGYSESEARYEVAGITGEVAFKRQLPTAAALGLLTSKFEAAPIGSFRGAGVAGGLRSITLQGVEEGFQSGTSTLNQNVAIKDNANPDQDLTAGVVESAVTGALAGVGQSGVTATPAAVGAVASEIGSPKDVVNTLTDIGGAVVDVAKPVAQKAQEVAAPVVETVSNKAEEIAERPLRKERRQQATQARRVQIATQRELDTGTDNTTLESVGLERDLSPVPESLQDVANNDQSMLQNTAAVVRKLAAGKAPTEAEMAYVASQVRTLKTAAKTLPPAVQKEVQALVRSEEMTKIVKKAMGIDLNKTQDENTEITPDVVSTTVSVAKTNPANVNATVVKKILKESGDKLSPRDVELMKTAQKVSELVDIHAEDIKDLPNVKASKKTSRSIQVDGYKSKSGKALRSINDFAADIFEGAQSTNQTVSLENGQEIPVTQVAQQFGLFVQHMNNKMTAANQSLAENQNGKGRAIPFDTLVGGRKLESAGSKYASTITIHGGSDNSLGLGREIEADTRVAVGVYNALLEAFPDQFEGAQPAQAVAFESQPASDTTSQNETVDATDLNAEIDAQEAQERSAAQAEDAGRKIRKDAVVKKEESLIDYDDDATNPQPTAVEDDRASEAPAEEVRENEQQAETQDVSGPIVDDGGKPIKFYHGTNKAFDTFKEGSNVFLTTSKALANEHALREGVSGARLIEANVKLDNPLIKEIEDNDNPDNYWLNNSLKIEQELSDGNYDGVMVFNSKEMMVIATDNSQIEQLNGPAQKEAPAENTTPEPQQEGQEYQTHSKFSEIYEETDEGSPVTNLADFITQTEGDQINSKFRSFLKEQLPALTKAMNERLQKLEWKNGISVIDAMKQDKIQGFRQFRATVMADPKTGTYDQNLLELAGIAVLDWLSQETGSDPRLAERTLEKLNLTMADVKDDERFSTIITGVASQPVVQRIAKDTLRMWGMKANDVALDEEVGVVEGIIKEYLTVLDQTTDLINILPLHFQDAKGNPQQTETVVMGSISDIQKDIASVRNPDQPQTAKEFLFNESRPKYSIGEKLTGVAATQNRSDVPLSKNERAALKEMQDTPFHMDVGRVEFAGALGPDALYDILGWSDHEKIKNPVLRQSVKGKNLSIELNMQEVTDLLQDMGEDQTQAVHFPVGITKVGRHQFQGPNPQSNKVMRALVTPTWADLDFSNVQHMGNFWMAVAQATGVKVEKANLETLINEFPMEFQKKHGKAMNLIKDWMQTGEMDSNAFVEAVGVVEMQHIMALHAVAEMELAAADGSNGFRTSLSFELDGLTNGAANMMVNFGQGTLTERDYNNFQRIGMFLGQAGNSINQLFQKKDQLDLYEITSRTAQEAMYAAKSEATGWERDRWRAAMHFSVMFGSFEVKDGKIVMTRNTAKNPMTKVNYGSGVQGVGVGLADDMIIEMYQKLQEITDNDNLDQYFYRGFAQDFKVLTGQDVPGSFENGAWTMNDEQVKKFRTAIAKTVGTVLAETTKTVIGDKITEVNDMMVFSTNVQATYLKMKFQENLKALAEKKGVPLSKLTRKEYNAVADDLAHLAPLYVSDDQQLAVAGFSPQTSNFELSTNLEENLRQKSILPAPEEAGVKAIPFTVIGTGDAMMMNLIFSKKLLAGKALPVFDGIDVPIDQIQDFAQKVNSQVLESWDRDVMAMATTNFQGFLNQIGNDPLLAEAFATVKDLNKKSSVVATDAKTLMLQLDQRLKENRARKAVFKRIAVTVDQMGGSGTGYVRGTQEQEQTRAELNREIGNELNRKPPVTKDESYSDLSVSSVNAEIAALSQDPGMTTEQRKVLTVIKKMLSNKKVVFGSLDQVNNYRQENYPDDGQFLAGAAQFDSGNDVVFVVKKDRDTLLHELVHAATFDRVLDHYEGNTNDAVTRLEDLMREFVDLKVNSHKVLEAQGAILEALKDPSPQGQAAAVNEFMAYALANQDVTRVLKETKSKTLAGLAKKVIHLMRKLMGGVPADMFSQVVFNTKLLREVPKEPDLTGNGGDSTGGGNGDGGGSDDGGEMTPNFNNYTNYWIDLMRQRFPETTHRGQQRKTILYAENAQKTLDEVIHGGFNMNQNQKKTFLAIHMVMQAEAQLDPQSLLALQKAYNHVVNNLSPAMFGTGNEAQNRYSAVMEMMGNTENEKGISDAVSSLLALSQTSRGFREALGKLPEPETSVRGSVSLNDHLTNSATFLMNKVVGSIDDGPAKEVLDNLSQSIIIHDTKGEFDLLQRLTASFDTMDRFTSGAVSKLVDVVHDKNADIQRSVRSDLAKKIAGGVAVASNVLDPKRAEIAAEGAKTLTHMGIPLDGALVPIREFVAELVGTDAINKNVVALLDKTNSAVSAARQAYREDLPGILQNLFNTHPDERQWKSMFNGLAKTDFSSVFDSARPDQSMRILGEQAYRLREIKKLETTLDNNLSASDARDAKDKAEQLAGYLNGNGAGHLLLRNAYAIAKNLDGGFQEAMVDVIDQLTSLYAIDAMDADVRNETYEMYQNDPEAVSGIMNYIQGLNDHEDAKVISEQARLNGYKGYIPNHGKKNVRVVIAEDASEESLKARGFVKLGSFGGDVDNLYPRSYYVTSVRQKGNYSQGVMQSVQGSYRGVDATTGFSVNGETSGMLTGDAVEHVLETLVNDGPQGDAKETLIPVFDENGEVLALERAINPDVLREHMGQDENLAVMMGAWAGRQVEEMAAKQYNIQLVDELKNIWDNRETGTDDLFVDLSDGNLRDPVYAEAFRLIPQEIKNYIDVVFADGGFMVRKDMVNLSVGYREASVTDIWSGKTRMPKVMQNTAKAVLKHFPGQKAMTFLSRSEEGVQGLVSTAKDIIVVRSLVVPAANAQSNVIQLMTRGVPQKRILKGFREKLAEVEQYNKNRTKVIELEARLRLAGNNPNKIKILEQKIKAVEDLNKRMSVAPLIAAGQYKNLSEGITDFDVDITSGRLGDYVEKITDKLPNGADRAAKYALVSKSTKIYQVANRAVQYGDFIAKSIYFDHLMSTGLTEEQAMVKVTEEFVNFSVPQGRTRSYLETIGATWFMAFKIRAAKIGLQMLREQPVRSFAVNAALPDIGSPVQDNIFSVIADDRLGYAVGWDMLFGAPELNPWINLTDW